eukprot:TRINITY_DN3650_c0_g4_i1.p1 TRINITY_DN3650_c0_g4~~TRINITY_DN3650_c0_g4_i1.p1  ORF type:complete len:148 (+),score=23.36 TRINITY_DN3650_c0_g4_i1:116-559(+)
MYKQRHVVIKNLFDPTHVDPTDLTFYSQLAADLRSECAKLGELETLRVFENSPQGVAVVKFKGWLGADRCIRLMHNRYFDQRQLTAKYYDGKTNYVVEESLEAREARDRAFQAWLEGEEHHREDSNAKEEAQLEEPATKQAESESTK